MVTDSFGYSTELFHFSVSFNLHSGDSMVSAIRAISQWKTLSLGEILSHSQKEGWLDFKSHKV